jgi:hypothetical protein
MRIFSLILAVVIIILSTTEVSAAPDNRQRDPSAAGMHTCKIVTGYGTAIGKGASKLAAKEAARELCGTKMIDDYLARRGRIEANVVDDLALACVNLECE